MVQQSCFIDDPLSNVLHKKVMNDMVTKSRLDIQFAKNIPLETVISQQMKEEGHDQKY